MFISNYFESTVEAICYSVALELCLQGRVDGTIDCNRVAGFTIAQVHRMPDFLRLGIMVFTLLFSLQALVTAGAPFQSLGHARRWQHFLNWKHSRLGFRRDFVRFFESLTVLGWHSLPAGRS